VYQDHRGWPTEEYARTVQFSPNSDRSDWPDEVRPYYSGFLQGMDKLNTGENTPLPTRAFPPEQPEGPDENGRYGSPPPYYYRQWR